jgi:hypothetical protein
MKKITLLLVFVIAVFITNAQPFLGLYTFDSVKTTSGTTDPSFVPTATGVTFGSFAATGTPPNPNAALRFSFTNWPTGSVNGDSLFSQLTGSISTAEYYEVTISPVSGCTISLDTIRFGFQRSATGVRTYSVRSSLDGFANNLTANIGTSLNLIVEPGNIFFQVHDNTTPQNASAIILTSGAFSTLSTPVTFRFYAWNSEGTTGTFSIDNVRFKGSTGCAVSVNEQSISDISISPNPSVNGLFNLDMENSISKATVSVYNIIGKMILTKEVTSSGKQNIDLSNESNGVYFVNVKTASSSITKKIIITK